MECGKGLAHAQVGSVEIQEEWHKWGQSEYDRPIPFDLKIALIISAIIDSGFLSEERQSHLDWTSGQSIFEYDPKSNGATDYMALVNELIAKNRNR